MNRLSLASAVLIACAVLTLAACGGHARHLAQPAPPVVGPAAPGPAAASDQAALSVTAAGNSFSCTVKASGQELPLGGTSQIWGQGSMACTIKAGSPKLRRLAIVTEIRKASGGGRAILSVNQTIYNNPAFGSTYYGDVLTYTCPSLKANKTHVFDVYVSGTGVLSDGTPFGPATIVTPHLNFHCVTS